MINSCQTYDNYVYEVPTGEGEWWKVKNLEANFYFLIFIFQLRCPKGKAMTNWMVNSQLIAHSSLLKALRSELFAAMPPQK